MADDTIFEDTYNALVTIRKIINSGKILSDSERCYKKSMGILMNEMLTVGCFPEYEAEDIDCEGYM